MVSNMLDLWVWVVSKMFGRTLFENSVCKDILLRLCHPLAPLALNSPATLANRVHEIYAVVRSLAYMGTYGVQYA